ncbi:1-acyl-sn-glycerol-3-phosphate acyltransferase, partial [Caulobacter sp. S45]|uniref:lysophospholipid acyltransferase family protein n=1 Tax=Caulobacter sp. S45 TaxID=1641861 RepID=UPI001576F58F
AELAVVGDFDAAALGPQVEKLFAGWMFGSAIVLGLVCLPMLLGSRQAAMRLIQVWARGVFWGLRVFVGAHVEVRGREHLPGGGEGGGGYLIAAKHQSMLDTLVATTLTPWPCIVLKRELMFIPIFGWYAWKSGMIAIDRRGGPGDVRQLLAAARRALADGRQVVIYPEGTRRAPGAPPAYKGGIGLLYKELGVACVPCATDGGRVWPAHGLLKHPGVAVFEVLPALAPGLARKGFMARLEAEVEGAARCLEADSETGS